MRALLATCGLLITMLSASEPARADAPFATDDAAITKGWEINLLSSGTRTRSEFGASRPAIEIDYGLTPLVKLHLAMPFVLTSPNGGAQQYGYGDTELAVKIRVFDPPEDASWLPRVAVAPLIQVPTGNADRGLGAGRMRIFLPIWMDKELAEGWTAFGGGGYWINQQPTIRDYWFVGGGVLHDLTEDFHIGAEVFHQTGGFTNRPLTGFNLGVIYDVNEVVHLLASAGRGVRNIAATNEFTYFVAIQFTF